MSAFNDLFDGLGVPQPKPGWTSTPKRPEKGVAWNAKVIDGDYYVPLSQVADLLAANDALPAVRKGIEARVRAQADRKREGL